MSSVSTLEEQPDYASHASTINSKIASTRKRHLLDKVKKSSKPPPDVAPPEDDDMSENFFKPLSRIPTIRLSIGPLRRTLSIGAWSPTETPSDSESEDIEISQGVSPTHSSRVYKKESRFRKGFRKVAPKRMKRRRSLSDKDYKNVLLEGGVIADQEELFETDVLFEYQRGIGRTGLFSSEALNALDPAPWTNCKGIASPYTPFAYPLPSKDWTWVHPQFLVDMSGDVDEHGFEYATRFHSNKWTGKKAISKTARRRRWVRTRYRAAIKLTEDDHPKLDAEALKSRVLRSLVLCSESEGPFLAHSQVNDAIVRASRESKSNSTQATRDDVTKINYERVTHSLQQCKLDRERLELWKIWLGQSSPLSPISPPRAEVWDVVERHLEHVIRHFTYRSASLQFLELLLHSCEDVGGSKGYHIKNEDGSGKLQERFEQSEESMAQSDQQMKQIRENAERLKAELDDGREVNF